MKHLSISDDEYQSYLNGEITLDNLAEKYSVCPKTIINKLNKEGKVSRLKYRQEVQKDDFFDYIDTEEKAYILGFYIGDGCILQGENNISSHKKGIQEKWLNQSDSAKCSIPLLD